MEFQHIWHVIYTYLIFVTSGHAQPVQNSTASSRSLWPLLSTPPQTGTTTSLPQIKEQRKTQPPHTRGTDLHLTKENQHPDASR